MDQQIHSELPPLQDSVPAERMQQNVAEMPGLETHMETQKAQAIEQGQPAPAPQPQLPPVFPQADPVVSTPAIPLPAGAMPVIADDTDLIEKEWVLKAKEIVARTKHDPYQQNKEVERVKADYLKKRYNKDIKITDE